MHDDPFRRELFEPLIGSDFRITFTDGTVDLTLTEVTSLPSPRHAQDGREEPLPEAVRARRNPFTLLFRGPAQLRLPQQTYRLEHDAVAEPLDIFIVPIGVDSDGHRYQAIFN